MFVGHLAAALAAKKIEPRTPLGAAVAAGFGLDLIWPLFLLGGLETVRINPGDTAFTNLAFDFYPWSHSLAMVVGWSLVAALVGGKLIGSKRVGTTLGALVMSHWILDLVAHRPDLPVWPGGPVLGMGLWYSVPGTLVVEGSMLAIGLAAYRATTRPDDRVGSLALSGLLVLSVAIWAAQPWAPPPPSTTAVAVSALAIWLFPVWAGWADRHRSLRPGVGTPAPTPPPSGS
ncbi:MAG: hypothetical protein RJQ04_15080 [Longimicrobiales bacterium]